MNGTTYTPAQLSAQREAFGRQLANELERLPQRRTRTGGIILDHLRIGDRPNSDEMGDVMRGCRGLSRTASHAAYRNAWTALHLAAKGLMYSSISMEDDTGAMELYGEAIDAARTAAQQFDKEGIR